MRPALLCLLLTALSWPALAQQDQSQTAPTTAPPPSSQAPAQPSTPTGGQQAPATETPPSSAKTGEKKTAEKNTAQKKTSKKKSRKNHKKAAPKKPPETTADAGPKRIVVRRGGTSDTGGQLEPGVPQTETDHQRQATEQLLESTDASLKNITRRTLTPDQQDMVRQISLYMEQSRSANREGDLGRARNLAEKAHMLCDALARQ